MADAQGGPDDTSGAIPSSSAKKAFVSNDTGQPVRNDTGQKARAVPARKTPPKKVPAKKAGSKKAPAKAATGSAQRAAPAPRPPRLPRAHTAAVPGPLGETHVVDLPAAATSDAEPTESQPARGSAAGTPIRIPLAIGLTAASLGAVLIRRLRRR